jgi:hypothetical protein
VVQESGQADQAYQQEQFAAWDPSHLLYTVLLSQGIAFTTALSVIYSIFLADIRLMFSHEYFFSGSSKQRSDTANKR